MDGVRRRIVVGDLNLDHSRDPHGLIETVSAQTCDDVRRQLWMACHVELVIPEEETILPDGTWHDLIAMIAGKGIPGEVHVMQSGSGGTLRCAPGRGLVSESSGPPKPTARFFPTALPCWSPTAPERVRLSFDVVSTDGVRLARQLENFREDIDWQCSAQAAPCEIVVEEGPGDSFDVIITRSDYVPPPNSAWFLIRRNSEYRYVGSFHRPSADSIASAILQLVAAPAQTEN